jgi:RNA polymerase sigma-70 factor, ECF subfamily
VSGGLKTQNQTHVAGVRQGVGGSKGASRDAALLARVAVADRDAFDELYGRTAPWLTARLRRRCHDEDLVAEVLQETYLAVWRAAASYSGEGEVGGWIWSIAARRLIDAFRRQDRASRVPSAAGDVREARSAEELVLHDVVDSRLAAALAGLSPELRAVLQATVLDGLSTREAAVLLDIPENTVKSRARRGRIALREALA